MFYRKRNFIDVRCAAVRAIADIVQGEEVI
jgi:hypothetical protein